MSESRTPPTGPGHQRGATPVGGDDRRGGRRRGLLIGALLLAGLIVLALLLSQCAGSDPEAGSDPAAQTSQAAGGSSSASADPSSSASAGASSSAAPSGGAAGGSAAGGQVVTADGQQVLALAAGPDAATALAGLSGQQATATGARVLSVPADEGFWLGTSETERVWVQLTGEAGESPYQVQGGDLVDFEGMVVTHDATFPEQTGVDAAEGAQQLADQGAHITAAKSAVRLSA